MSMHKHLLVLLMIFSTSAVAEITRWVDESGRVHYSDGPPPVSAQSKKLRSNASSDSTSKANETPAESATSAPKTVAERAAELRKAQLAKQEAADKNAQKQAEADAQKVNCANAQQSLKALQDGIRLVEFDANGERSYIDDEQRQQRIAKTQEDITRLCK